MLGNAVREICPDEYGNLWIGTEDNGINQYHLATGEIINYSYRNPLHPLSATNIHGLMPDGDKLWIGTYNKGIDILDIPSGKVVKNYCLSNTNYSLLSDFILCFTKTKSQGILIGTSVGTVRYDSFTDTFHPWKNISGLIKHIHEDQAGNIWVASTEGVFRYVPEEDRVYQYVDDPPKLQSLGSSNITSVFEDSKNRIWVTTVNGISFYDRKTDTFTRIIREDGMPSNIIYRILEDEQNYFWITTANGLVKFNPETYATRTFSFNDGLHEAQFNYSSAYKSPEGVMYMGTINGMISFNPRLFKEDTFVPPVYILPGKIEGRNLLHSPGSLELPYNRATFTLSYVALSYTSPNAIRYAYKLEGVDGNWIDMGRNRSVTFANLSPGKYTFKVRSTNSSGIWQNNEESLSIVIIPPFWATGWAFGFYILMLVLLIYLFYNYKKTQLIRKHRINQEIFENKKEKELYDAKIQFFTFITHEIRTPLTLIKAPLEKILRSNDGTPATRRNLEMIEQSTQRLLDLSNQLLDFRKTESQGFKLNFVKTDIVLWLDTTLAQFKPVMEKENKRFILELPAGPFCGYIDRDAFSKIITNLMTNAIKYSSGYISLTLKLTSPDESRFRITVINDGPLIPAEEKEKIFTPFFRAKETEHIQGSGIGLSLAYSLTEFHRGSLVYDYTPDGMNSFTLELPVNQDNGFDMPAVDETVPMMIQEERTSEKEDKATVLIVEDQVEMRRFIAAELAEIYQVKEAGNGQEALEILHKENIKLIVSDVMMPVMDGFEFCNEVKNNVRYSHIPFVILTAQHNLQSRLKGLNNGADAYIEKPFSMELLITQISNLLRSRELLSRSYQETPHTPTATLAVSPVDEMFLTKLNEFLEANLNNDSLNVELLATEMNMSTSSLYRKVKGISGVSPVDFIRIARLKKAVQLIHAGETRINEIAFQTGFSSPAYFSTCFQKQYGKSPSEFMKENRK